MRWLKHRKSEPRRYPIISGPLPYVGQCPTCGTYTAWRADERYPPRCRCCERVVPKATS